MVNPADQDERALLAAILSGYPDLPQLAHTITGADFHQPIHETIWNAALDVHADGNIPDPNLIRIKLGSAAHKLPGGATYLIDLAQEPIVPAQAPLYAKALKGQSVRRTLSDLGASLRQLTENTDVDPEDLLSQARTWMDQQLDHTNSELVDITAAFEAVVNITENGVPDATPTPWESLNEIIDGWHPGNLITIGARPGVGKSILLENAATHVARTGKRVLFVSLEMSATEITQRTLAHTAKVPLSKIRQRISPNDPDVSRIAAAAQTITSANIAFADRANQTLADIRANAWQQKQAARRAGTDLGLIAIDYLQLIASRNPRLTRQQQVGEFSRGLKQLAKELDVPILAAAQLNRGNQNRTSTTPVLSDLREAGDIEQDSDIVILLHEETVDDGARKLPTGDLELIVAKNRHGATGHRTLRRWGHFARVGEAA